MFLYCPFCASVFLTVRTELSSGCLNCTAQQSWPGSFCSCSYGGSSHTQQLPVFISGYLCSSPRGRGKRQERLPLLAMCMTHVWHCSIFGSSGAGPTQQQEISVKIAHWCVCSQAKCMMSLCQDPVPATSFLTSSWRTACRGQAVKKHLPLKVCCCSDSGLTANISPSGPVGLLLQGCL